MNYVLKMMNENDEFVQTVEPAKQKKSDKTKKSTKPPLSAAAEDKPLAAAASSLDGLYNGMRPGQWQTRALFGVVAFLCACSEKTTIFF